VHRRLIVAFIVVALVAALAFQLAINLLVPLFPRLNDMAFLPPGTLSFLYKRDLSHRGGPQATPFLVLVLCLAVLLLLAVITALAFAASRPVLQPVRRLARAAQRMSGGDLSVRIQPRGRDELAQLVTSFNEMAAALEDKVADLKLMEARARQFAGDVSHELRTPLTAMTAVVGILGCPPPRSRTYSTASWDYPSRKTVKSVTLISTASSVVRRRACMLTVTGKAGSGGYGGAPTVAGL
jgi:signal transduction histidine kinase